jgi:hypothetical protein
MNLKWAVVFVIALLAVGAGAAYAGYTTGVNTGRTQAAEIRTRFLADRAGTGAAGNTLVPGQGAVGGGAGGVRQFNNANVTIGEVKEVDAGSIKISTARDVTTVKLTDQTVIEKTGQGTPADLKPGERVVVQGAPGADGVVNATTIQVGGRATMMFTPGQQQPGAAPGGTGGARPGATGTRTN